MDDAIGIATLVVILVALYLGWRYIRGRKAQ